MIARRYVRVLFAVLLVLVPATAGLLAGSSVESEAAGLLGAPPTYTITASAGTGGSISPLGAVSVNESASQA